MGIPLRTGQRRRNTDETMNRNPAKRMVTAPDGRSTSVVFFRPPEGASEDAQMLDELLAQSADGLGCFLVPTFLPDETRNALALQRLKKKLGNRSNATAEVELNGAHGWLIGEPAQGVKVMIEMLTQTRLDCAVASTALMRHALAQAIHHAEHRAASGDREVDLHRAGLPVDRAGGPHGRGRHLRGRLHGLPGTAGRYELGGGQACPSLRCRCGVVRRGRLQP